MKNPFEKNDYKVLIGGIVLGSLAAGALAYLFLTETGSQVRQQLSGHVGRLRDAFVGGAPAEQETEHIPDYLNHKAKAPKTDREKLKKHEILHEPPAENEHHEDQQS